MVSSIQSIATDQPQEKLGHLLGNILPLDEKDNSKFRLLNLLQSTLDLETLLKYFLESLRAEIPIGGLSYDDEGRNINIRIGKQSSHSCGYRLTTHSVECGEIVFKRESRFSELELQAIEENIVLLLAPISNAIKYSDAVDFANRNIAKQLIDRETLGLTLHREIELAKRHNHPLTVANIAVKINSQIGKIGKKDSRVDDFADHLYREKDATQMLYRVAEQEFLLIASGEADTTARAIESIIQNSNNMFDDFGAPELAFKLGCATVTGTDSISSVLGRAKKYSVEVN